MDLNNRDGGDSRDKESMFYPLFSAFIPVFFILLSVFQGALPGRFQLGGKYSRGTREIIPPI